MTAPAAAKRPTIQELVHQWRRSAAARRTSTGRPVLLLTLCLGVLVFLVIASFAFLRPESAGRELTLDQLAALSEQSRVARVTLLDEDARMVGRFEGVSVLPPPPAPTTTTLPPGATTTQPSRRTTTTSSTTTSTTAPRPAAPSAAPGAKVPIGGGKFWVAYPRNDATTNRLIERLSQSGASVRVDPQTSKGSVRIILTVLLPLIILANLFALFFVAGRGASGGLGEVTDFSRIGGRGRNPTKRHAGAVTFEDVAGVDEAVAELSEVVDYLANPDRYRELGAAPPKGVLLFGPPGCGKTLLAKAVAGEAGVPFFSVAGAEFVESLVGVGAARVRDLFARVRAAAPAIVFIDELDAAGRRRGSGGGSEERDQTLNQLLVEMDGFEVSAGIVVIGATNRPDILDPALLRPGRFDRHITIERPDLERREAILELHARRKPLESDVDFARLARQTPGFSGADLANVVNEAALLTIRTGGTVIGNRMLTEAVARVLAGPQRRGHLMSEEERHRIAVHEAGRAITTAVLGKPEERVSIVARSRDLAMAVLEREDDSVLLTEGQLQARLTAFMAGRAAELVVFGDGSTGTESDIEAATALARDIAGRYGLSDAVGPRRVLAGAADLYLGGTDSIVALGGPALDAFDEEVSEQLDTALRRGMTLIRRHRGPLDKLVARLLAEETVEGDELVKLLPKPPAKPSAKRRS